MGPESGVGLVHMGHLAIFSTMMYITDAATMTQETHTTHFPVDYSFGIFFFFLAVSCELNGLLCCHSCVFPVVCGSAGYWKRGLLHNHEVWSAHGGRFKPFTLLILSYCKSRDPGCSGRWRSNIFKPINLQSLTSRVDHAII